MGHANDAPPAYDFFNSFFKPFVRFIDFGLTCWAFSDKYYKYGLSAILLFFC